MSKYPVNELITRFLGYERKKRRMRIVDVAEIGGIPTSSYSCLERGRYRLTAESLLQRILTAPATTPGSNCCGAG